MRRRDLVLAAAIVSTLVAGGSIYAAPNEQPSINIDNFSFTPAQITVPRGTKIIWTNRDDIPHTVTDAAGSKAFKSPPLDTGNTFAYVFSSSGTYHYFCALHPHMQGTVVVK